MIEVQPSQRMRDLGVVQHGAGILAEPTGVFDLPAERAAAERVIDRLSEAMDRIAQAHDFSGKGMGLAAPQIAIGRAAATVRPTERSAEPIILLNPRITAASDEMDEQYEGCLSFFDVRGLVPRPPRITVETTALDGTHVTTEYERGLARLIHREIGHLDGLLYTARTGVAPTPVEEYRQTNTPTGRAWAYEQ
ncbi:peptide deformylase [Streptomyces sp. NPDC059161]|uniref:peptide deformylase n=1 Tax=Streptomyces sp. NPDC059161 TaxID=3346749 RepID=UPI0036761558